jgi:glutamate 5-kinase
MQIATAAGITTVVLSSNTMEDVPKIIAGERFGGEHRNIHHHARHGRRTCVQSTTTNRQCGAQQTTARITTRSARRPEPSTACALLRTTLRDLRIMPRASTPLATCERKRSEQSVTQHAVDAPLRVAGTVFMPSPTPVRDRKRWVASLHIAGKLTVNQVAHRGRAAAR